MKRQNTKFGNSRPSKSHCKPRAGRSADECSSLPRNFDDWLQSEREELVEKVLLSWRHPNIQTNGRSDRKMIFKV